MILHRYIRREVLKTTWIILSVLSVIALGSAFLELVARLSNGVLLIHLLLLLILQIPRLLVIILPISFFAGILLTYSRMFMNGQMVVWQISGVQWTQLIQLLIKPTLLMSLLLLLIQGWGVAYCAKKEQQIFNNVNIGTFIAALEPGQFRVIPNQNKVIYVGQVNEKNGDLQDIFIADIETSLVNKQAEKVILNQQSPYYTVIRAQLGQFIPKRQVLLLKKGFVYQSKIKNNISLKFDSYEMQIPMKNKVKANHNRELLTLPKLWASKKQADRIELIWQIGCVVNLFVVLLLAVPLSYVPVRKDMKYTLIIALLIVVLYYNFVVLAKHWLSEQLIPIYYGIWWVQCLAIVVVGFYSLIRIQVLQRLLKQWKTKHET